MYKRQIYINVKGREPQGIVEPGAEYTAVCDEIEDMAYEFRDPRTGRKLIGQVLRREQIYSGPHMSKSPDLILIPKDPSDIFFGLADFGHRVTVDTVYRYSGMHRTHGMLIISGPNVRTGTRVEGAVIWDIAPTILYSMGLPVPSNMDGRVLTEAFAEDYIHAFPPTVARFDDSTDATNGAPYSEMAEKEILRRLRGLGYLG